MPIGSDKGNFIKPGFDPLTEGPNESGLYVGGYNYYGVQGNGNTANSDVLVQNIKPAIDYWASVDLGFRGVSAVSKTGTLWGWGINQLGQLGLGNTTYSFNTPQQVGALTTWGKKRDDLSAGVYFKIFLKTDGTAWGAGYNDKGQLGDGTVANKSSPVQIGSLTDWLSIASGYYHSLSIKTNNTLWAWGGGASGVLGQGNSTNYSSPVQVGTLTNWEKVACGIKNSYAIKTDGTLWAWGDNAYGQVGQNDSGGGTNRSSPVQIGALTTWASVHGAGSFMLAIKTDGTLYGCGYNNLGQLGDGTTVSRSSLVQIGALNTWANLGGATYSVFAIKTDSTLWSWGSNTSGELGSGNTINRSSPVQVGNLVGWLSSPGKGIMYGVNAALKG